MNAIHIEDLTRSDELTIQQMKAAKGGFTVLRPAGATYEFPSMSETTGAASSLSFIRSATSTAITTVGSALETVARKG